MKTPGSNTAWAPGCTGRDPLTPAPAPPHTCQLPSSAHTTFWAGQVQEKGGRALAEDDLRTEPWTPPHGRHVSGLHTPVSPLPAVSGQQGLSPRPFSGWDGLPEEETLTFLQPPSAASSPLPHGAPRHLSSLPRLAPLLLSRPARPPRGSRSPPRARLGDTPPPPAPPGRCPPGAAPGAEGRPSPACAAPGRAPGTGRAPADRSPEDGAGSRGRAATRGRAAAVPSVPPPPCRRGRRPRPAPARPLATSRRRRPPRRGRAGGGRALPVHVGAGLGAEEAGRPSWLVRERRRGGGQAGEQSGGHPASPARPRLRGVAGLLGAWGGRVEARRDASGGPVKGGRGGGRRGEPPRRRACASRRALAAGERGRREEPGCAAPRCLLLLPARPPGVSPCRSRSLAASLLPAPSLPAWWGGPLPAADPRGPRPGCRMSPEDSEGARPLRSLRGI